MSDQINPVQFGKMIQAVEALPEKIADKITPLHEELHAHMQDDKEQLERITTRIDNIDDSVLKIKSELIKQNSWWNIVKYISLNVFMGILIAVVIGITVKWLSQKLNISLSYLVYPYQEQTL